jgi:tRNA-specific 2-thiouridylase
VTSAGRIAVAMSGGVDSSAAAALLKEQGYDLVGFSMQLWDQQRNAASGERRTGRCCSVDDLYDARGVAARLKFPYYVVNFQKEFEQTVVRTFIESYRSGYTPSPCALCNSYMKFDHLVDMADGIEATHVATGHYARVDRDVRTGRYQLYKGRHNEKDQSYFLFGLTQDQLARAMFPLGELQKNEVRDIARRHGLEVAEKPESQEICFVPDDDYAAFIERHYEDVCGDPETTDPFPAGDIVSSSGRVMGNHQGIHHYTIGQRRGLGIAHHSPLYVVDLDPAQNRVIVGERSELAVETCRLVGLNWIAFTGLEGVIRAAVKIRSRHPEASATITPLDDRMVQVDFDVPQHAVTPGQAAVLYQEDRVLGGGWISRQHP